MGFKRILGILILLCGIALVGLSLYINEQVAAGKIEIAGAEQKVEKGSGLFSLNPISKQIGQGITDSAQKKINAGKEEISNYEELAGWAQMGGIGLIIFGIGVIFIGNKKK